MLYLLEAYSNLALQGRMVDCSLNWGQGEAYKQGDLEIFVKLLFYVFFCFVVFGFVVPDKANILKPIKIIL